MVAALGAGKNLPQGMLLVLWIFFAQRQFGLSLQACEGSAQLVCGIGDEAFLRIHHLLEPLQQIVDGADQRSHLLRRERSSISDESSRKRRSTP